MIELNDEQLKRYARHIVLSDVGKIGQQKLLNAKVLVIGAGGLGSPVLMYLAAAGVGHLGIVDFDTVDTSNLQRQIIHNNNDVERPKVKSAKEKISLLNEDVDVKIYRTRLSEETATEIFSEYDIVVDGSDNFKTRYIINKTAWDTNTKLVSGALNRFEGQLLSVDPSVNSACYECVFPTIPDAGSVETCQSIGILGATAGVIGTMQATEVLKLIIGIGTNLTNKLMLIDTLDNTFRTMNTRKDENCKCCGD